MNEPKQKRRLSELIRAGAALRPQAYGVLFRMLDSGEVGSCALGAAYEANFNHTSVLSSFCGVVELQREFPILTKVVGRGGELLTGVIMTMNDHKRLTREEIADWVETIEAEEACKAIQANPEPVTA